MSEGKQTGALNGVRVIDLATARAEMAGRVLADLGAEVIKVEPPEGADTRFLPPFEDGHEGDPDASLCWAAMARGKQCMTLDLQSADQRKRLLELIDGADILIESFDPGYLAELGLGFTAIHARNPALVYVSVTPFGQDGPAARDPATNLTLEAAGGLLGLQGDGDRPPVPISFPQAAYHAGVQAAADAVIALNARDRTGAGQHLDVSTQACMVWCLMNATGFPPNEGRDVPGTGPERPLPEPPRVPGLQTPAILKCADGYVTNLMGTVGPTARALGEVVYWRIEEEGPLPDHIPQIDWNAWATEWKANKITIAQVNEATQLGIAFLGTKTKREIIARANSHGLLNVPIVSTADLLEDVQFQARDFWVDVGGRTHAGPFARFSRNKVGNDTPAQPLATARSAPPPPAHSPATIDTFRINGRAQPFTGLKVADFAWVGVGPIISKFLADHGATVVRIESAKRPDVLRMAPPFKLRVPDINNSQFMANFNSSKLGLALDMSTAEGRQIARQMIDWCDVTLESFTPGTMDKFGLGWEEVSRDHPDLIRLSTCLRGQTGPERSFGGFGNQGAALAGLHGITGWADRPPAGPYGAYTDMIAPRFGALCLAAAIFERARSGKGQHIDLSQVEAGVHFLEPLLLDYTVNGRIAPAGGHDSLAECPHGVYRTGGLERYIAISVSNEAEWSALCKAAGLSAFADNRFASLSARLAVKDKINAALAEFCAGQPPFALASALRAAGVPASVVLRPSDLYEDPQLLHREFFVTLPHSKMGPTPYDGPATLFSDTPAKLSKAAPMVGEDTDYVLTELLGLPADEVSRLREAGIFV